MMKIFKLMILVCLLNPAWCQAQGRAGKQTYSRTDTLRGSITPERAWWDVLRYDITIKPDYHNKTTQGINHITYRVLNEAHPELMQIDLKDSLRIDSIVFNKTTKLDFRQQGNLAGIKFYQENVHGFTFPDCAEHVKGCHPSSHELNPYRRTRPICFLMKSLRLLTLPRHCK